jgi:hypothetical protein
VRHVHASHPENHKRFMAQPLFIFTDNSGQEAVWQGCRGQLSVVWRGEAGMTVDRDGL